MICSRAVLMFASAAAIVIGLVSTARISHDPAEKDNRMYVSLPDPMEMIGKRRIFVSGHSLTARPLPDFLKEITAASQVAISWDGQHLEGSSIRDRSFGQDPSQPWSGFGLGHDAGGQALNVLSLLRASEENGEPFDVLLITEQHRLLDALLWQETKRYLRAYRDRFLGFNPQSEIVFFTPWISLSNKDDLTDWIAYERAAWPVWQCTIADVNGGHKGDEASKPIRIIPASLGLAALMEDLQRKPDQPGFEGLRGRQLTNAFFLDTVHLTPLGAYFVAALTASALYGGLPSMAQPSNVPDGQAKTLQRFATSFIEKQRRSEATSGAECGRTVNWAFAAHYTGYIERTYRRAEMGYFRAKLQRLRDLVRFARAL